MLVHAGVPLALIAAALADGHAGLKQRPGPKRVGEGVHATGQGQRVDASLLNGMLFAHTARLSVFHETGEPLPRYGSGHPEIVPYQAFEAADGWIFVAAWVDRLWLPFCKAVGVDAKNCQYCHVEKLPKKGAVNHNDRGKWLVAEKQKRDQRARSVWAGGRAHRAQPAGSEQITLWYVCELAHAPCLARVRALRGAPAPPGNA